MVRGGSRCTVCGSGKLAAQCTFKPATSVRAGLSTAVASCAAGQPARRICSVQHQKQTSSLTLSPSTAQVTWNHMQNWISSLSVFNCLYFCSRAVYSGCSFYNPATFEGGLQKGCALQVALDPVTLQQRTSSAGDITITPDGIELIARGNELAYLDPALNKCGRHIFKVWHCCILQWK